MILGWGLAILCRKTMRVETLNGMKRVIRDLCTFSRGEQVWLTQGTGGKQQRHKTGKTGLER